MLSMKFLLTLWTVVVAQQCHQKVSEAADGSCLLAKKKMMGKASLIQEESMTGFEQMRLKHKDWRLRHLSLETAMNKSKSLLDKFIEAQETSNDHCSSRLMESKRVLDGILANVQTLSKQVTSREEVIETETENLQITKLSIKAVTTEYTKTTKICTEQRTEALMELKTYSAELHELNSIANPSVRIDIAHSVKVQRGLSLAQVKLDKTMCKAFVNFAQRIGYRKVFADPKKMDCDKQRDELQKAFEEAYKETRKLKKEAKIRSVDKTCFETAETKKTVELVPLVSQRDQAVEKIEVSSQAIAAIDPVLSLVKDRAEKLRIHIDETLTPECADAEEASKVLERVRELILVLEECPGRNDFKLKIPPIDDEEEKAEVPKAIPEEESLKESDIPPAEEDEEEDEEEEEEEEVEEEVPKEDETQEAVPEKAEEDEEEEEVPKEDETQEAVPEKAEDEP